MLTMNPRSKIYLTFLIILLLGAGIFYLIRSKFFIGADELLTNQKQACKIDISGKLTLTHIEQNSNLKLLLTANGSTLAETSPLEGKYHFIVEGTKPSGAWDIVARENLGGKALQYPVSSISGLECDSNNTLNLEL